MLLTIHVFKMIIPQRVCDIIKLLNPPSVIKMFHYLIMVQDLLKYSDDESVTFLSPLHLNADNLFSTLPTSGRPKLVLGMENTE